MFPKFSEQSILAAAKSKGSRVGCRLKDRWGQTVEGPTCHVKAFALYSLSSKKLMKTSVLGKRNYFRNYFRKRIPGEMIEESRNSENGVFHLAVTVIV